MSIEINSFIKFELDRLLNRYYHLKNRYNDFNNRLKIPIATTTASYSFIYFMFSTFIHPTLNEGNFISLFDPSWKWGTLFLLFTLLMLFYATSQGLRYIIKSYYKTNSGYDEPHLNYESAWENYHEDLILNVEKTMNESNGQINAVEEILPTATTMEYVYTVMMQDLSKIIDSYIATSQERNDHLVNANKYMIKSLFCVIIIGVLVILKPFF